MKLCKCGYECLIVWEHELKDREKMIRKIKKFILRESYND